MITDNPYKNRSDEEIKEIQKILTVTIPKMTGDRLMGFGDSWNDEKENNLQEYLDNVSEKYDFDFRLRYSTNQSLWPEDYKTLKFYL